MGCDNYRIMQPQNGDARTLAKTGFAKPVTLTFYEEDGQCLCTFPHNYADNPDLVPVKALALLGAAIVLAHQGIIPPDDDTVARSIGSVVPDWIKQGIAKQTLKKV